ncbi:unnamed protein product [Rhodiola kirilowii]
MEIAAYLLIFILSILIFVSISRKLRRLHENRVVRGKLPPGSMGWPYIGETMQLYSEDPSAFFASKQKRHGEIFKTHILGCPCVMLASPEAARFVLVTQAHLFKPTYPKSKENFIGPSALFFHQGDNHMRLRKLVQGSLTLNSLRNMVADVDAIFSSALDSWAGGHVINTFHELKKISFEVGILAIFGGNRDTLQYTEELKKNYSILTKGYNSFPTVIPGTLYDKAKRARMRLSTILGEIIRLRMEKGLVENDLLGSFLNYKGDHGEVLSDNQIADNIIGVLFAAQDTTASVMTWTIKFLHDNPKVLEAVKAEQNAILKINNGGPLSWSQTREMPFSYKVVLESLRMSSIISFLFREAVVDVEYKGYLIPKGWKVMPLFRNIHHNPQFFPDPHKFDPSRFEVAPKPNTYIPFGNGVHACPGNELAKLELLVMIHHLVTKFRWELEGSDNNRIQYSPFPIPHQGLPAKFWKQDSSCDQ